MKNCGWRLHEGIHIARQKRPIGFFPNCHCKESHPLHLGFLSLPSATANLSIICKIFTLTNPSNDTSTYKIDSRNNWLVSINMKCNANVIISLTRYWFYKKVSCIWYYQTNVKLYYTKLELTNTKPNNTNHTKMIFSKIFFNSEMIPLDRKMISIIKWFRCGVVLSIRKVSKLTEI